MSPVPADGVPFQLIAKQVHYYTWINSKRIASIDPHGSGHDIKVTTHDGRWTIVNLYELQGAPANVKPDLVWHEPGES